MVFEALKTEAEDYQPIEYQPQIEFADKELPEGSMSLRDWLESAVLSDIEISENILPVVDYVVSRGLDPLSDDFYWSPAAGYADRVIVPFRWGGRTVGNTARKIAEGKPKYISDQHPHFVFNFDRQRDDQKYIFVCEGPFDALSIGGVALLTNDVADQQARIINSLDAEIIVIPDQDPAGLQLIDRAVYYNWSVAFPNWDDDVKDVADAVHKYGRLFVTVDAIKTAQKGEIKIKMYKKQLEQRLERSKWKKY
jgi:hypothetical protein